jgi:diaminopimelate decarboxylase
LTLVLEPGRFMVAESGLVLARVLYRKRSGGKEVVITDAGMNDLIRPSHYAAYHEVTAVAPRGGTITADVVGPVCETGDFLALDRTTDDVRPGDLVAVHTAGAYGFVMASNYNSRPRPAEVLVDGPRYAVVTERERYDDLVRQERAALDWRAA